LSTLRSTPEAVDLVLTDVMMPFLDGFGLLKEIRSRDEMKMLPVIMLSARAGEEASAEGLAEGADDYLIKPFTARELLSRVASHLNMSRMRNDAARTETGLRMEVHEGKERLERILASIQDAFVTLDAQLRYSFVNANAAVLLGAKKEGKRSVANQS
jgi:DNA-binding response OmpR family regulator